MAATECGEAKVGEGDVTLGQEEVMTMLDVLEVEKEQEDEANVREQHCTGFCI